MENDDDLLNGIEIPPPEPEPGEDGYVPEEMDGPAYAPQEPETPLAEETKAADPAAANAALAEMQARYEAHINRLESRLDQITRQPAPQFDPAALERLAQRPVQAVTQPQPYTQEQLKEMYEADPVGFNARLLQMQEQRIAAALRQESETLRAELRAEREAGVQRDTLATLEAGVAAYNRALEAELDRYAIPEGERKPFREEMDSIIRTGLWKSYVTTDRRGAAVRHNFEALVDPVMGKHRDLIYKRGAAALATRARPGIPGGGLRPQGGTRHMAAVPADPNEQFKMDLYKSRQADRRRG